MIKLTNEQLVARLRHYLELLKTSCGNRKDRPMHPANPKIFAQIFQEIEEYEDMKYVLNVNVVFYKDINYKWQYEIRLIIDECMFVSYKHKEIILYEAKLDAQRACAEHLADLIETKIDDLIKL